MPTLAAGCRFSWLYLRLQLWLIPSEEQLGLIPTPQNFLDSLQDLHSQEHCQDRGRCSSVDRPPITILSSTPKLPDWTCASIVHDQLGIGRNTSGSGIEREREIQYSAEAIICSWSTFLFAFVLFLLYKLHFALGFTLQSFLHGSSNPTRPPLLFPSNKSHCRFVEKNGLVGILLLEDPMQARKNNIQKHGCR